MASAYSVRPLPDARVSTPLTWDEVPTVEAEAFTLDTVPARYAAIGDPGAGIDDAVGSLEALLELCRRHEAEGLGDAPWPPNYAKQAGEPPRVQPSKARRRPTEYEPGRGEAGGPPPEVAAERAAAVAAGDPNAGLPTEWAGSRPTPDRPPQDVDPGRRDRPGGVQGRGARGPRALEGAPSRGVAASSSRPDILVDGMRGRSTLWYRVRVNLIHVPEADRPAQEPLEVDYDPWAGYEWPDRAGQLERAPRTKPRSRRPPEPARAGRAGRRRRRDLGRAARRGHDRPGQPVRPERVRVGATARATGRRPRPHRGTPRPGSRTGRASARRSDRRRRRLEADDPVARVAGRPVGLLERERGHQPVRRERELDDRRDDPARGRERRRSRRVSKRRIAAVASATSTSGGEAAGSRVEVAPTTSASPTRCRARSQQVRRLLDDLAAALVDPSPPGRRAACRRASGRRRAAAGRAASALADRGQDVERRAGGSRRRRRARLARSPSASRAGPSASVGGQRLLGQERDAALDQPLADRHGPVRRHARRRRRRAAPSSSIASRSSIAAGRPSSAVDRVGRRRVPRRRRRRARSGPAAASASRCVPAIQPAPTRPEPERVSSRLTPPKIWASSNGAVSSSWS